MLAAKNHLRKETDITRVYKRGSYGAGRGLLSVKAAPNGLPYSRAVVVVSKKINKRAVVRNRIRRRLAAILAAKWGTVALGYDIVVSVHVDIAELSTEQLELQLGTALKRAKVIPA
jgi:ribonuclease P protein component